MFEYVLITIFYIILLISMSGFKKHKAIAAWRIATVISVLGLAICIFLKRADMFVMTFFLAINCFIVFPVFSQNNMCPDCGKCFYWKTWFTEKCPYCKERF